MKLKFPWNLLITGLLATVVAWPIMSLMDAAQLPVKSFPDHDVAYSCLPTIGDGPAITFKFTNVPNPRFDVSVSTTPATTDLELPVIASVTNSAGIDITSGAVKLVTATAGLAATVTATDNTGVVIGKLEVDGKIATPFGNGLDVLPNSFYVRWNAKSVSAGAHVFRLAVCDAALNCAVKTWSMTK
jgi:hypothetical protein